MKVMAITAEWCGKCQQAKKKLAGYDVEWVDIDLNHRGLELSIKYDVTKLPTFLVFGYVDDDVFKSNNVLEIKMMLDQEREFR